MIITRTIEKGVEKHLFKGQVIIIYGPRQSGKTTLVKKLLDKHGGKYLSCDDPSIAQKLTPRTPKELKDFIGSEKLVVIDEAQRVRDIGLSLKILVDNFPDTQIIATGSSSFELANKINEPLTGRNIKFYLMPVSLDEARSSFENYETEYLFNHACEYGLYPRILNTEGKEEKINQLKTMTTDYLFKDLLSFGFIRSPLLLENMLKLLATRIGKEISYSDLADTLNASRETVYSYITYLEQSFIIFRLTPYYTNKNKEVSRQHKIYFYDIGIRNSLVNNFEPLKNRSDAGEVFENVFVAEMQKKHLHTNSLVPLYFWKGKYGSEIDLVIAKDGFASFETFECKFGPK